MQHDNPAVRLHKLLVAGQAIAHTTPCRAAWAHLLDCEPNNGALLFLRLGKVMQLPGEAADLVRSELPHQVSTLSLWHDPVQAAFFNQNLGADWKSFSQHINTHCIAHLGLTADLLGHRQKSTLLDEADLKRFESSLSQLRTEILASELNEYVKRYLDTELTTLLRSISEYRITGGGPILKEVEAMFGHLVRDPNYRSFLTNEELGRRLLDQLSAMANLVTVAVGLPQLTVVLAGLLPK